MVQDSLGEGIRIEVAYATPNRQLVVQLEMPAGSTVLEAIRLSGIELQFSEIDLAKDKIGIFGRFTQPDHVLAAGDRVEIYRPLKADPKEVRRRLAAEGKTMGKSVSS